LGWNGTRQASANWSKRCTWLTVTLQCAQVPRNNFDTLMWGGLTVFQIITGENWNSIMYDAIRGNGILSCLYFISLVRAT
jgi:hypothetical protein